MKRLRSAQLLRSLGSRNEFSKAVAEVSNNLNTLKTFLTDNQRDYLQPGRLKELERDAIEEELGVFVKRCSSNISQLQSLIRIASGGSPAKQIPTNTDMLAHRQGMILILSEKLGSLTKAFDRLRAVRYQQIAATEASKARRTPVRKHDKNVSTVQQTKQFEDIAEGTMQEQVMTSIHSQNAALQNELLRRVDEVANAEKTVREIATLNQMFSTAILAQSEQIEQLYTEAVAATSNLDRGNVQLQKAIRSNKSGRKYLFIFLILSTLGILFLDWFYS